MQTQRIDFTLAWRRLANAAEDHLTPLRDVFAEPAALDSWLLKWPARCADEDRFAGKQSDQAGQQRAQAMRKVNSWLIPRNHHVEEALVAASNDHDFKPFEQLLEALQSPYDKDAAYAKFAEPAPDSFTAGYRTFCGT